MTLILMEKEVDSLLEMSSTLKAVEEILRQHAQGYATNRARRRVALPKSALNFMAAGAPEIGALGLKAYTVARSEFRFYTMLFDPTRRGFGHTMSRGRQRSPASGAKRADAEKHRRVEPSDI